MKIQVDRRAILAMQNLASTDETRYVINSIAFEVSKESVIIVATDGRSMGAMQTGIAHDAPEKSTTLAVRINQAMLRALPRHELENGEVCIESKEDGSVTVSAWPPSKKNTCFGAEQIEGSYPQWRGVVPTGVPHAPLSPKFDYSLLESFVKVSKAMTKERPTVQLAQVGDDGGVLIVKLLNVPKFIGFLMPLRGEPEITVPDWAKLPETATGK